MDPSHINDDVSKENGWLQHTSQDILTTSSLAKGPRLLEPAKASLTSYVSKHTVHMTDQNPLIRNSNMLVPNYIYG